MEIRFFKGECLSCGCDAVQQRQDIMNGAKKAGVTVDNLIFFSGLENAQKQGVPEVPALVVDGELVLSGFEPKEKDVYKALKKLAK